MLTDLSLTVGIVLSVISLFTTLFAIPSAWSHLKDKVFHLEGTMNKVENTLTTKIDAMQKSIENINCNQAQLNVTMEIIKKKLEL